MNLNKLQERSTIEKARVGGRRQISNESYYYPVQECLRKCCPRSCVNAISGNRTGRSIEDDAGENVISPILKYALFLVNVLFWVASLILLGVGCWALATKELEDSKRVTSAWDFVFDVTIIFLVVGCLAFLLASCGCIGALRENVCLLRTYCVSLIVIDLILIVVGIVGLSMWSRFLDIAKTKLSTKLIINYDDDPDLKDMIDFVQEQFECCGISDQSYLDWNGNIYYNCSSTNADPRACGVPHSCCLPSSRFSSGSKALENFNCGFQVQREASPKAMTRIHTTGCVEAMENSIKHNILLFCLVSFGVSLIPLIGIYLAMALASQIIDQRSLVEEQDRREQARQQGFVVTRT